MKNRVGVLLALYNGEKYIEKQLESLLEQTVKIDCLIIGDDGSTDNGIEIVNEFIRKHDLADAWTVEVNENNLGHAGNFINMCNKIDAEYVFFCDQDDIWMPDKIETMIDIMEKEKKINLLYAQVINTSRPERKPSARSEAGFDKSVSRVPFSAENYFFKGLGCGTCVRGEFMKSMLRYWTKGWEHDMFFWCCAVMTDSGYLYNYPVIWRRIHDSNASISGVKTLEKRRVQVVQSTDRPEKLKMLLTDNSITGKDKILFAEKYGATLKRRRRALEKRNVFLAAYNILFGQKYYLHKKKGAILDLVLIVFGKYPIK